MATGVRVLCSSAIGKPQTRMAGRKYDSLRLVLLGCVGSWLIQAVVFRAGSAIMPHFEHLSYIRMQFMIGLDSSSELGNNSLTVKAGVLLLSAFPFTAVKAIANSSLGARLQERMNETKAAAELGAARAEAAQRKARQDSPWYGQSRPRWLGPIPCDYPGHLKGDVPGDYGFDLLGLGTDREQFKVYYNFEVLHARWAMLAALGAVIPELLDRFSGVSFTEPVWWRVGYAKLQGDTLDYLGIPGLHVAGAQGVLVIAVCQVLLMVGPEYARYCGIEALEPLGIYLPGDINYPGGWLFDPLGLSKDSAAFEDLKVKEIKNGRLAMVAWLGFYVQALVTKEGPIANLCSFVSDPAHDNIFAYLTS